MMNSGLSTADAVLLTDRNNGSNNGGMWGGDGAWWIIILFLFCFAGWGGNGGFGGFGGGGAATQGALTREQACIDNNFQNLMRETAGISDAVNLGFANLNSTVCNQQYDTARMINSLENTIQGGFNATNVAMLQGQNAQNVAQLQSTNAIQAQLAQCCCDNKAGLAQISYDIATNACGIQNTIQNTTRDMIDVQNANTRAILDKLTAQEIAAKDAQIAAQNQRLFAAELQASQANQNQYLINTLRPTAVPAYLTCSPYASAYGLYGIGNFGGYGNNCGCGCN